MHQDLKGKKIKLIRCNDPYSKMPYGLTGTVRMVDAMGTVHVNWDNGSSLGLCPDDGDDFEIIE